MALGGFPGHGTTQYTSVHHHTISHEDGEGDSYNGDVVGPGYVGGGVAGAPGFVNGVGAPGFVNGAGAGYISSTGAAVAGGAAFPAGAIGAGGYLGGVGPVNRYGVNGAPAINGNGLFGNRVYRPRHVHVGVGTPGVKVEVETAKSVISSKPVHVTAQVFRTT